MRVVIVGSSGYIAGFLLRELEKAEKPAGVFRIDRHPGADAFFDLWEAEKFDYAQLRRGDLIVFTAGISAPDTCAEHFEESWEINVTGTCYFIQRAMEKGCKVLFFSSDAVFGDNPHKIFTEVSATAPTTPYGKMKKAVEDAFFGKASFKSIRLSYVASARDKFISYCFQCMRKGKKAEIFHPFYRNVIGVSDVVRVVRFMMLHWEEYEPGCLNVAGRELVSRIRMADEINRLFDNRLDYDIVFPDKHFFVNRPKITQMRSLYSDAYNIMPDNAFTEKMTKELEGIKL